MVALDTHRNRRHKLLIDPPVQLGIALRLVGLWAGTALLAALLSVLLTFFSNPTSSFSAHLGSSTHWIPNLLAFGATLPIALLLLLRFSHRFAGPVFRLRNELHALAAGHDPPPLAFRKGDYWTELADEFNAVAERLRAAPSDDTADYEIPATLVGEP